jgi:sulfoxide reductase heme-binding subunit YedZ
MMKSNLVRYPLAFLLLIGLLLVFAPWHPEKHPIHFWNRIIADASYVMLCLTLIIGPAAQFAPRLWPLLPWRRELGVVGALAAMIHVVIYMASFQWNPLRFFFEIGARMALRRDVFAASNWVGLLALGIIVLLGITANDFSQKWLGRGWKFLQQQNYTLVALAFLHILLFFYLVYTVKNSTVYSFFWWLSLFTLGLQTAGFIRTVRLNAHRRGII